MSTNKAIRTLHTDLTHLKTAEKSVTKAQTNEKTATANESKALKSIATQKQQLVDSFTKSPPADPTQALNQLYSLGEKEVKTQDTFSARIAKDKKAITNNKKTVSKDHKQGLKDLKPAEFHLSLKDTNAARKQLGLKAVSKPIRVPASKGLTKAVSLAMRAVTLEQQTGVYHYTQDNGGPGDSRTNCGAGVLSKIGSSISFDCSGFVGALYKEAGLASPYSTGYTGTSFDVSTNPNMKKVSEAQAKPGDVVVFPDHIALYIGDGKVVSMGEQGEPAVVTVAAEAAYHNRGIQGFYHLASA